MFFYRRSLAVEPNFQICESARSRRTKDCPTLPRLSVGLFRSLNRRTERVTSDPISWRSINLAKVRAGHSTVSCIEPIRELGVFSRSFGPDGDYCTHQATRITAKRIRGNAARGWEGPASAPAAKRGTGFSSQRFIASSFTGLAMSQDDRDSKSVLNAMGEKYNDYLKTDYWKAVSDAVKKRADYRCQVCNSQHDLQAHHRTYDHRGRELEYLNDLTCLCRRCHGIFHGTILVASPVAAQLAPQAQPQQGRVRVQRSMKVKRGRGAIDIEAVNQDMPSTVGLINLTHELIEKCRTHAGAFTNATLRAWDLRQPLIRGWPERLIGTLIDRDSYRRALEGRYLYNTGKLEGERG